MAYTDDQLNSIVDLRYINTQFQNLVKSISSNFVNKKSLPIKIVDSVEKLGTPSIDTFGLVNNSKETLLYSWTNNVWTKIEIGSSNSDIFYGNSEEYNTAIQNGTLKDRTLVILINDDSKSINYYINTILVNIYSDSSSEGEIDNSLLSFDTDGYLQYNKTNVKVYNSAAAETIGGYNIKKISSSDYDEQDLEFSTIYIIDESIIKIKDESGNINEISGKKLENEELLTKLSITGNSLYYDNNLISNINDSSVATDENSNTKTWSVRKIQKALDDLSVKGEENVIESISINGVDATPTDKKVNINLPTKVSELENDSKFTTETDLGKYYDKDNSYSKDQIDTLLGDISSISYKIVTELPEDSEESPISTSTVYLIKHEEDNIYEQYMYIDHKWSTLGSLNVNLTDYYDKDYIDQNLVKQVTNKGLSTNDLTNELKKSYDDAVTNNHKHDNSDALNKITSPNNVTLLWDNKIVPNIDDESNDDKNTWSSSKLSKLAEIDDTIELTTDEDADKKTFSAQKILTKFNDLSLNFRFADNDDIALIMEEISLDKEEDDEGGNS